MELIEQEIEMVKWILENRKLGVCEREALEHYFVDRVNTRLDILKDICYDQSIKWYPQPVIIGADDFNRAVKIKKGGKDNGKFNKIF